MLWVVVKFLSSGNEEIEVVPINWLKSEDECWWPSLFKKTALERAIKLCTEPNNTWQICTNCKVISKTYDKFSSVTMAASKAQYTSDIDEQSAAEVIPGKRRIKKNPRFIHSESEDEDTLEDDDSGATSSIPEFPKIKKSSIHIITKEKTTEDRTIVDVCNKPSSISSGPEQKSHNTDMNDVGTPFQGEIMQKMVRLLIQNNNLIKNLSQEVDTLNEKVAILLLKADTRTVPESQEIQDGLDEISGKLPLINMDAMSTLENALNTADIYKALVLKLSHIGGENYREVVRRIMAKSVSDELAQLYSWIGHKGKRPFCKLLLAKVVVEAVELVDTKNTTLKSIEAAIAKWLTKAPERLKRINNNN